MKALALAFAAFALVGVAQTSSADPAGIAAAQSGLVSLSAPIGMTFISSLGTTESISGNPMKIASRDDAALYVASDGAEDRPALEMAYRRYLEQPQSVKMNKMTFAVGLLAQQ